MRWSLLFSMLFMAVILLGCSGETDSRSLTMADTSVLPVALHNAHHTTRDAYRYAIANPDELAKYPCYCGCNSIGHTSNLSCYVQEVKQSGEIIFDLHGSGCGVCIDITQDVMRMKRKGMASPEIRRIIDDKYNRFGPPTDTALPES